MTKSQKRQEDYRIMSTASLLNLLEELTKERNFFARNKVPCFMKNEDEQEKNLRESQEAQLEMFEAIHSDITMILNAKIMYGV